MSLAHMIAPLIGLAERGRLPDAVVRTGIRRLIRARSREIDSGSLEDSANRFSQFLQIARSGPIAELPEKANEQHYEVPAEFFGHVLGTHRKYSCCYWTENTLTLDQAEHEALSRTCENAGISDGQTILELGCGWGSLSLWMAERYPSSNILAVSNSASQREYIEARARERGLTNLRVQTCDINHFSTSQSFDRVVSVEMFEHVRNHARLMKNVRAWLKPEGRLFVHIFCHHRHAYAFEDDGNASWMARYFFSGGIMPSQNLLLNYQEDLQIERQWCWDGRHYQKTSNAWLRRMDDRHSEIEQILREAYGDNWLLWHHRWRMFFMSCAELFGYGEGREWFVAHYLFRCPSE